MSDQALDNSVYLFIESSTVIIGGQSKKEETYRIWLLAGSTDSFHDRVQIKHRIHHRLSLDTNKARLLEVIQPMARSSSCNSRVDLINFDPGDLINVFMSENCQ